MGSSHPRATPHHGAGAATCPGGSSQGGTAVVWGCCWSSMCAWIPRTPVPLQRPEGKLRHRYPADAAHPCWLQLWCPSQQEALVGLLGMAWSHVEMAGPSRHLIPGVCWDGNPLRRRQPRGARGGDGVGLASPGLPGPLPEVAQPPRFSWLRESNILLFKKKEVCTRM